MKTRQVDEERDAADDGAAPDILSRTALSLSGHALPAPKAVAHTLAHFTQLHRLDVSHMQGSDEAPEGLVNLHWLARAVALSRKRARAEGGTSLAQRLTWLNLSGNAALGVQDDATDGLELLTALHALRELKALVLSHNEISALPTAFPHLPELNTLVLSNNALSKLPMTLPSSLPSLKKLSVSHNSLTDVDALPDLSVCAHLREVRLCGNKALGQLPEHIVRWGRGIDGGAPGLVLLDASDCGLDSWDAIAPLLRGAASTSHAKQSRGLANLCLRGNRIAEAPDYQERILAAFPGLRVLDNVRLHGKKAAAARDGAAEDAVSAEPMAKTPPAEESAPVLVAEKPRKAKTRREAPGPRPTKPRVNSLSPEARPPAHERPAQTERAGTPEARAVRKRAHDEDTESAKKVRKRSGRGPKRRGEAKAESTPEVVSEAPAAPSSRAVDGGDRGPSAESTKKTRRKKKAPRAVEMDMGDHAAGAPPRVVPPANAPPASPPTSTTRADTGIVKVVDVARAREAPAASAAALLGRRADEDLGGW